jgi:hypothetical protein
MSIEAMQQALNALEYHTMQTRPIHHTDKAIEALRQAIEQAEYDKLTVKFGERAKEYLVETKKRWEQEPFGYFQLDLRMDAWVQNRDNKKGVPFYTAPPKREWVGLNWDDIPDVFVGDIDFMQGAKWALAKLKEKNGG